MNYVLPLRGESVHSYLGRTVSLREDTVLQCRPLGSRQQYTSDVGKLAGNSTAGCYKEHRLMLMLAIKYYEETNSFLVVRWWT